MGKTREVRVRFRPDAKSNVRAFIRVLSLADKHGEVLYHTCSDVLGARFVMRDVPRLSALR